MRVTSSVIRQRLAGRLCPADVGHNEQKIDWNVKRDKSNGFRYKRPDEAH